MENQYICKCGVYTYYCECVPATHSPYYDDILERLQNNHHVILSEDDVTAVLCLLPKNEEIQLVLHPMSTGYYAMKMTNTAVLPNK
jgi:hypothetical protein